MNAKRGDSGFTLVELLVAISILALVAVLGWRGLDGILRARTNLTESLEQTRGLQLAFAQLQHDCDRLAASEVLFRRPAIALHAGHLLLVRHVFAEGQPSRLQIVRYSLEAGTLVRNASLPTRDLAELDRLWLDAVSDAPLASRVVLQTAIHDWGWRVWLNGWRTQADALLPARLPADAQPNRPGGIELSLFALDRGQPFVRVLLLGGT